jgi:hypothetical protein
MTSSHIKSTLPRIVLTLAVLAIPTIAAAKCSHPPTPWKFGGSLSSTWRTTEDSVCLSTSNHPENIATIEIEAKPKNGVAGKNGPYGIAYKPNPGFRGSDSFSYAVTSNAHYRLGVGHVARVTIYVIAE